MKFFLSSARSVRIPFVFYLGGDGNRQNIGVGQETVIISRSWGGGGAENAWNVGSRRGDEVERGACFPPRIPTVLLNIEYKSSNVSNHNKRVHRSQRYLNYLRSCRILTHHLAASQQE